MIGQVGSAVDTAVRPVAAGQVGLERFGLGHLHHRGGALLAQRGAGAEGAAALRASLTEAALEDARKSRGGSGGVWPCPHSGDQRKTPQPGGESGRTALGGESRTAGRRVYAVCILKNGGWSWPVWLSG